jgi:hypothetical protein
MVPMWNGSTMDPDISLSYTEYTQLRSQNDTQMTYRIVKQMCNLCKISKESFWAMVLSSQTSWLLKLKNIEVTKDTFIMISKCLDDEDNAKEFLKTLEPYEILCETISQFNIGLRHSMNGIPDSHGLFAYFIQNTRTYDQSHNQIALTSFHQSYKSIQNINKNEFEGIEILSTLETWILLEISWTYYRLHHPDCSKYYDTLFQYNYTINTQFSPFFNAILSPIVPIYKMQKDLIAAQELQDEFQRMFLGGRMSSNSDVENTCSEYRRRKESEDAERRKREEEVREELRRQREKREEERRQQEERGRQEERRQREERQRREEERKRQEEKKRRDEEEKAKEKGNKGDEQNKSNETKQDRQNEENSNSQQGPNSKRSKTIFPNVEILNARALAVNTPPDLTKLFIWIHNVYRPDHVDSWAAEVVEQIISIDTVTHREFRKFVRIYHPDKNGGHGEDWLLLCGEITKVSILIWL